MDVSFCANTFQRICLQVPFSVVNKCEMWKVKGANFDCFGFVVFAIDCVECRTVSQSFMCVLVACLSTWYGVTVNVWFILS